MVEPVAPTPAPPAEELLDSLPCGVVTFEDDGTIVALNSTLAAMLGYERAELEGKHVETLLTIPGRIFFQTHVYPIVRLHGHADELFVLLRCRDGSGLGALVNAVRHDRGGRPLTDCVVLRVQERRKYEEALLRAKQASEQANAALHERTRQLGEANESLEQHALELELQQEQLREQAEALELARGAAEEANRAKSQFLAVMSHELRTPLNAIGGYVQLMELGINGPVTDAQRESLERITRAQRHLLRLINDVLNLARIEAGRVEYTDDEFSVAEIVSAVMPMLEPQIAAGGLTAVTDAPRDMVVHADREKVQQILINLLTNAVKFTPAGGRVAVAAERSGTQTLIHVTDSGIGIPADKLQSVFEPFVQVEVGHTRRREGSGLGLAISRDLARGMGGDLSATSIEGRGSTFTLALPTARS